MTLSQAFPSTTECTTEGKTSSTQYPHHMTSIHHHDLTPRRVSSDRQTRTVPCTAPRCVPWSKPWSMRAQTWEAQVNRLGRGARRRFPRNIHAQISRAERAGSGTRKEEVELRPYSCFWLFRFVASASKRFTHVSTEDRFWVKNSRLHGGHSGLPVRVTDGRRFGCAMGCVKGRAETP